MAKILMMTQVNSVAEEVVGVGEGGGGQSIESLVAEGSGRL